MVAGEARLGASHLRAAAGPAVARCAAVRGTRSRSARLPAHREGHAMRRCASARACFVPSLLGFLHYHDDLISRVVACTEVIAIRCVSFCALAAHPCRDGGDECGKRRVLICDREERVS